MPEKGNTGPDPSNSDTEIIVEDGILPRFGVVTFIAVDSDEFRGLRGISKHVYLILALFAGSRSMECFPKQRTIARMAGVTRVTVNRAIQELVEAGLVKKGWSDRRVTYRLVRPPSRQ